MSLKRMIFKDDVNCVDCRYEMLKNEDIADIPIERLIQVDRTLVGIWCTNAPSMIEAVKQLFLPKWKLKLLATWFWIKVRFDDMNFIPLPNVRIDF